MAGKVKVKATTIELQEMGVCSPVTIAQLLTGGPFEVDREVKCEGKTLVFLKGPPFNPGFMIWVFKENTLQLTEAEDLEDKKRDIWRAHNAGAKIVQKIVDTCLTGQKPFISAVAIKILYDYFVEKHPEDLKVANDVCRIANDFKVKKK